MPDREKYIEILSKIAKKVKEYNENTLIKISLECVEDILELLKEQEAVVRCKDCKWWHESKANNGFGDCGQANGITLKSSDWFCADGERK